MADDIRVSLDRDFISLSSRRRMLVLSAATLAMVALPAQAQTERKPFSPEELDQMLAPIALYNDALLSQVLMASTYPLEIVEAARWSQANPTYNPNPAYGQWPYPSYPPTYYPTGGALLSGLTWGLGFAAAGAMFGGWNWGGGGGYMNINASRAVNIDRNFNRANVGTGNRWQHDVNHRKGVAYRDSATRQQYGQARPGVDQRQQFRGQSQRPGGGNVASARPGAGPGDGPGAGNRPGGGAGGGNVQRPGGGAGGGNVQRPGGGAGGRPSGGNGVSGVNRGQQVNREAQRGRAQQQRAATSRGGARAGGGGRPGGGGGRR
jgi:hypothetical protein